MILKELYQIKDREDRISKLRDAKGEILKAKKAAPIHAEPMPNLSLVKAVKAEPTQSDSITIEVIGNLTNWMDSHNDVLMPGAFSKSINDKGNSIPFLKDHNHNAEGIIAETLEVRTQNISPKSLGFKGAFNGQAEALIFKARLAKDIDEKFFNLYKNGLIKQHSIGLQYVNLELAINDPELDEFKAWESNIDKVINKDGAEADGFFFVVREVKLFENSAVLFGSNSMTPTLNVEAQKSEAALSTLDGKPKSFYHLILNQNGNV